MRWAACTAECLPGSLTQGQHDRIRLNGALTRLNTCQLGVSVAALKGSTPGMARTVPGIAEQGAPSERWDLAGRSAVHVPGKHARGVCSGLAGGGAAYDEEVV